MMVDQEENSSLISNVVFIWPRNSVNRKVPIPFLLCLGYKYFSMIKRWALLKEIGLLLSKGIYL